LQLSLLPKDKFLAVRAATNAYRAARDVASLVGTLSSALLPGHAEAFKGSPTLAFTRVVIFRFTVNAAFHGFLAAEHKESFVRYCKERRLC
jgi:hypothetical protein